MKSYLSPVSASGDLGEGKMKGPSVDNYGSRFAPLVVLELSPDTKEEAIAWLLSRIRDQQQNGGMEARVHVFLLFLMWLK